MATAAAAADDDDDDDDDDDGAESRVSVAASANAEKTRQLSTVLLE
jgi:hypothetical protein